MVDDDVGLRAILRRRLERDPRFTCIDEAGDGRAAIAIAERTQPDLVVLDVQMPVLGGIEALPEIRRVSPRTAVILYTAHASPGAYQAAMAAGAVDLVEKGAANIAEQIVSTLVDRVSDDAATIEVTVGPVAADAARAWVSNSRAILEAVRARPDVLGATISDEVYDAFISLLDQWEAVASSGEHEFRWFARADPANVRRLLEQWASVDGMRDDQLDALGVRWSGAAGEPFWRALTTGVLDALQRHDELERLAARLSEQWGPDLDPSDR